MKRPYFASRNHSRRLAFAASLDACPDPSTPRSTALRLPSSLRTGPSTRPTTAGRVAGSLRVTLATLGSSSRQASTASDRRRTRESEGITGDLAASVCDEERHGGAFGHDDA